MAKDSASARIIGRTNTPRKLRLRGALAAIFAAALVAASLSALAPSQAFAKSYSMPEVSIEAEVLTDGTLAVNEQRAFDFDGSYTCVWWEFDGFPSGSQFEVEGVSLVTEDGQPTTLPEVTFQTKWRSSGGPGYPSYSVDAALDSVYVFFSATDEQLTVDLSYEVTGAAQVYNDTAELYWQYVGSAWAEPSRDVTCSIQLPVPAGETVQDDGTVRAWGHGALDGTVTIYDGGLVTYVVPKVSSGEFAEARIAFPAEWIEGAPASSVHEYDALPGIIQEEQQWADEANAKRAAAWALIAVSALVALALIAWALVMFFRHGKEYKPEFHEEYWRDVPDPNAQPAEIGRLWRWEAESTDDFTATVMQLAHKGAIRMERGSYADARGRVVEDYCMVKVPEVADAITESTDPLGRKVLDTLFDVFPAGESKATESKQGHVWFGTITKYGKAHPRRFQTEMQAFQAKLSQMVDGLHYFEPKGSLLKMTMATVGFLAIGAGLVTSFMIENFVPAIAGVIAGVMLLIISHFMTRMTHHGADVRAKCEALKRWLQDFSAIDERPPTDVKVWGEFMVYAYEFGIAEQVMKELQLKMPELFADEEAGSAYLPWWFWYSPHYAHGMGMALGNMLSSTIANTAATATAALSQSSSGGGFGGGFSMGGGGGFGGGGGGAR